MGGGEERVAESAFRRDVALETPKRREKSVGPTSDHLVDVGAKLKRLKMGRGPLTEIFSSGHKIINGNAKEEKREGWARRGRTGRGPTTLVVPGLPAQGAARQATTACREPVP